MLLGYTYVRCLAEKKNERKRVKYYDFCSQKKKSSLFEVEDVLPVMTNNFEDTIMKGVQVLGIFFLPSLPLAFGSIPKHTFPHADELNIVYNVV